MPSAIVGVVSSSIGCPAACGIGGLDADDPDTAACGSGTGLDRARDAGDEPTAADAHDHRVEVGHLPPELQA
jgi:hypothetical protein